MIGNTGDRADQQEGSRQDYLSLPYNDPRRKALRGMEAQYGAMILADNEALEAGGLFTGSLAGMLALVGAAAGAALALSGGAIPELIVGAILGAAGGAAVGTILGAAIDVRVRLMTPREWSAATAVFGASLPPRDRVILTDLSGLGGREFTIPASALSLLGAILNPALLFSLVSHPHLFQGRILVNLGQGFANPLGYTRAPYLIPGQVFMHELTHAWQVHNRGSIPGLICQGLYNQAINTLGGNVYGFTVGQQWKDYNLEQQGAIVDAWYATGGKVTSPYYRYISANVRPGSNDASSNSTFTSTTTTVASHFGGRVP